MHIRFMIPAYVLNFLLCFCLPASQAAAASTPLTAAEKSLRLFPETRDWRIIAAQPTLSGAALAERQPALLAAYRQAIKTPDVLEGPDCSWSGRAFQKDLSNAAFYTLDIDQDGFEDVVYTGSALCAEGNATLIWFGSAQGYKVKQDGLFREQVLRISADGSQFSSVADACCGAQVEEYFIGSSDNLRQFDTAKLRTDSQLPEQASSQKNSVSAHQSLILRSSPSQQDHYDTGLSNLMRHAVYGNIVRRYLPGANYRILSSERRQAQHWLFISVHADSDHLVTQDPYQGVRSGWIRVPGTPSRVLHPIHKGRSTQP
ncbi:hypothetical protein [Undibacterium curvum]|uniref:Uncharacterized protein n=1 Tax=Undibacterium curvum TaxID=2762294 RepID=A0ABR7A1M0_9BURK|nr:hypothetical protein [Undibacterium curvum]MBC3930803.1 hypothetical protein [Undibacterium curvum]